MQIITHPLDYRVNYFPYKHNKVNCRLGPEYNIVAIYKLPKK